MRSHWNRVGPYLIQCAYTKREVWTQKADTHTGVRCWDDEGRALNEAATSRERQQLPTPEARRGKEGLSPRGVRESRALQQFDFGFRASRTMREYTSFVLSHPVCGTLLCRNQLPPPKVPHLQGPAYSRILPLTIAALLSHHHHVCLF